MSEGSQELRLEDVEKRVAFVCFGCRHERSPRIAAARLEADALLLWEEGVDGRHRMPDLWCPRCREHNMVLHVRPLVSLEPAPIPTGHDWEVLLREQEAEMRTLFARRPDLAEGLGRGFVGGTGNMLIVTVVTPWPAYSYGQHPEADPAMPSRFTRTSEGRVIVSGEAVAEFFANDVEGAMAKVVFRCPDILLSPEVETITVEEVFPDGAVVTHEAVPAGTRLAFRRKPDPLAPYLRAARSEEAAGN